MGCDIHVHIEVKLNGKWEHFSAPYVSRDYKLFSILGFDRNIAGIRQVKKHELPTDISELTEYCLAIDKAALGVHDAGCIYPNEIKELQEILNEISVEEVCNFIDYDLEWGIFNTTIFEDFIYKHENFESARIVYWFDN